MTSASSVESTPRTSVLDLLEEKKRHGSYLNISAPMVRYSKLPFREVVRAYNTDVCYTPMILSDVFKCSPIAQQMEFKTTTSTDDPVIVQFAAANVDDIVDASEIVAPWCSGVDLNCGCPQKWAISEGIGSHLMSDPQLVHDMVRSVKSRTANVQLRGGRPFSCSVKIRVHADVKETVEWVRRVEQSGVDWITVHGRTRCQKSDSSKVNLDKIHIVKESVACPVFANGDVFSKADADRVIASTGCDGVMAARGLQVNPALFAGYDTTPVEAVKLFLDAALGYGLNFFTFHHHLMDMLDSVMSRQEKWRFNALTSTASVLDYLEEHYGII